ncbi:hypothetical protein DVT68_19305 [Dyella solisilvae]|uniref:Uncharacterized protein n=1 Tax=Dyella solisilvae TaxID=1920168 RepID=A0A370K363_9GAMM|nr:hypothetical protein DVT68_19305 [Dyella solisilvae]
MPSPWFELLCLHGYISDRRLLRRMAHAPSTTPPVQPKAKKDAAKLARHAVITSLRLCLGIGDGVARSQ